MTPQDVLNEARDQYNATGDTFFSDTLLLTWLTKACSDLATQCYVIERIYTTTTVASQQSYAYPTSTFAIKRVTYNGGKLKRVTHRQDDALTLSNQASIQTGRSIYYSDFNYAVYLRPIPDSANPLQIFSFNDAQAVAITGTLEVPAWTHNALADYMVARMFAKDQNVVMATYHRNIWKESMAQIKATQKKRMRSDSFTTVQDEETLPVTIMGES